MANEPIKQTLEVCLPENILEVAGAGTEDDPVSLHRVSVNITKKVCLPENILEVAGAGTEDDPVGLHRVSVNCQGHIRKMDVFPEKVILLLVRFRSLLNRLSSPFLEAYF